LLLGLLFGVGTILLDRHSLQLLGYDAASDEVILADRWFDRTIRERRYARSDVERIRVHWQATFTGRGLDVPPEIGWWMAYLVLAGGQIVHLHGVRGGREAPPERWLRRFRRAAELMDRPLHVIPAAGAAGRGQDPQVRVPRAVDSVPGGDGRSLAGGGRLRFAAGATMKRAR
jgi:hypothetical protein